MKELVGICKYCGRNIYCMDGFLDGEIVKDNTLICPKCAE